LTRLRRALSPKGTLVIVGGETDGRWLGGTDRQVQALLLSPFIGQKLDTFVSRENHEDMLVLKDLIEAGSVTPVQVYEKRSRTRQGRHHLVSHN
jgi:hypothetical protein